jgi:Zn-dependent protease
MGFLRTAALGFDHFMKSGPPLPIGLVYLAIVALPLTFLHEWGHAVTARRLLDGSVRISVGNAGRVAHVRLGQITTSINVLSSPTRLAGYAEFDASRATARDVVLIALSGPLASLLGWVVLIALYSAAVPDTIWHGLLWAAVLWSGFAVIFNLIPLSIQERRGGRMKRTDGGLALDAAKVIWQLR